MTTIHTIDSWISAGTEAKEAHFRGVLSMHITICKAIMRRSPGAPYLYADLYAGPGELEFNGRQFLGSPLIAQDLLTRAGVPHRAIHFEKDPDVAARLAESLWVPTSLVDIPDEHTAPIYNEAFQDGLPQWLADAGHEPGQLGLMYADPIRDEIPWREFNQVAEAMPKVDLLSYVSATQYKRRRGSDLKLNGSTDKPLLSDHIRAVNKRIALIRRPLEAWQWTFVLWSNWVEMPAWEQKGFYRLDSEAGQRVLRQLDHTAREQREKANTPLPFEAEGGWGA